MIAGLFVNPPWKGFTKNRQVEFIAEPVRVARSLWQEHVFSNPFETPTGYTAHVAPGLPFLQAVVLRFAGDGSSGWLALRLLPALALTVGVIYERKPYKPILDEVPQGDWRDTGEKFVDPETKRVITVYADPASGKRIYVGQPGRPA